MSQQLTETIVGGLVLATAIGFGFYAAKETRTSVGAHYEISASFSSAEGVRKGSEIRMAGIPIGRVKALVLNTQTLRANATFIVDKEILLPDDSSAVISSEGLLGGQFIEIMPGGSMTNLAEGDEITYTQGPVSFITLMTRFVSSSNTDK